MQMLQWFFFVLLTLFLSLSLYLCIMGGCVCIYVVLETTTFLLCNVIYIFDPIRFHFMYKKNKIKRSHLTIIKSDEIQE